MPDAGNSFSHAMFIDSDIEKITGSVGYSIDSDDYFKFIAPSSGLATIELKELTDNLNLKIYNASNNLISTSYNSGTSDEKVSFNINEGDAYYIRVDPYFSAESNYKVYMDLPENVSTVTTNQLANAEDIFHRAGDSYHEAGLIRVMADFSQGVYHLGGLNENSVINDVSPHAEQAFNETQQDWSFVNLNISNLPNTSTIAGQTIQNGMSNGWYIHGNAAAYVARSADSIVLSFRGTNDNTGGNATNANPNDPENSIHPDKDQWGDDLLLAGLRDGSMAEHYALFEPLINAFHDYVTNQNNGIEHVYVTGHSMGGAMAINYIDNHDNTGSLDYQAVTFAAPAFTSGRGIREEYDDDDRIIQIEIAQDPVPMTWNLSVDIERPGQVIRFAGNNTMDTPDEHGASFLTYYGNKNNHSMSYHREIVNTFDAAFLSDAATSSVSDIGIVLGGRYDGTNFIVDENDVLLPVEDEYNNNYFAFYGGEGDDVLMMTDHSKFEVFMGGAGADQFILTDFYNRSASIISSAIDNIVDFNVYEDMLILSVYSHNPSSSTLIDRLDPRYFISGDDPTPRENHSTFLLDTESDKAVLYLDIDGTGSRDPFALASFYNDVDGFSHNNIGLIGLVV